MCMAARRKSVCRHLQTNLHQCMKGTISFRGAARPKAAAPWGSEPRKLFAPLLSHFSFRSPLHAPSPLPLSPPRTLPLTSHYLGLYYC